MLESFVGQKLEADHPEIGCDDGFELGRFFWDESTKRVLAVTRFACASDLSNLTIRSMVTHDMPSSHELVGDLSHRGAIERSFFPTRRLSLSRARDIIFRTKNRKSWLRSSCRFY